MAVTTLALSSYLFARRKEWNLRVAMRARLRLRSNRHRLPDICVIQGPRPTEQVLTSPPFLCIEVLSPNDNLTPARRRIADFREFGVPYVWLIDPRTSQAWVYTANGETEISDGILRAGQIEVRMSELSDQ